MAFGSLAKTARLVASLELDDKFSKPAAGAQSTLAKLERQTTTLGRVGVTASSGLSTLGRNLQTIGTIGASALIGIGIASGKMAADFEANMANVQTLGIESTARMTELGDSVKRISQDTGKDLSDLSGGLYQIVSAFGDSADSADKLEIAAKASSAGLAETTDAVNLLSSVSKGYGDTSATMLGHISDLAFQTVKLGQTTFPELAASMGSVVPLASTLGVNVEELFGDFATLTGVTGNTSEVSTQLQSILTALIKRTPQMSAALDDLGAANLDTYLSTHSLQELLLGLKDTVGDDETALVKLFGRKEAVTSFLALTGSQAETAAEKIAAMGDAAGATDAAFEIQQQTVSATFGRIKADAQVLAVTLGEQLLPIVERNLSKIEDVLKRPGTTDAIKGIGESIANFAQAGIETLGQLPWGAIGDAAKFLGQGSHALLQAFTSLPPWVQTAVLTGWGLNKLTGGALGNIGVIVGKALAQKFGLIPIQAGVVNVSGPVSGLGGAGGAAAGGGRSLLGKVGLAAGVVVGGVVIGKEIAQAINDNVITPAKTSEQGKVTAVLEGNKTDEMVNALRAIDDQLNTSDVGAQVALITSRIPFIGDAIGNVAPELEKQRDQLVAQLQAQGYTNDQITNLVNASRTGNLLQSKQEAAITKESADVRGSLSAGFDTLHDDQRAFVKEAADAKAAAARAAADAKSSDAAMLGSLSQLLATQRSNQAQAAATAARTQAHLAGIERADLSTAASSAVTSRKNFEANAYVTVSTYTSLSVDNWQAKVVSNRIATGYRGGIPEGI